MSPTFGKPSTKTQITVTVDVLDADPVPSDNVHRVPFTPTTLRVEYTRTGTRKWLFSRAVLTNRDVLGLVEGCATVWGHRPKALAAAPAWVREFVEANMPGATS